jgi:hypothetical protein
MSLPFPVGHLLEMLRASSVDAELSLQAIPALDGALDLLRRGIASSLAPNNLALSGAVDIDGAPATDPRIALLYDPQTAGGLLASLPAESVDACLSDLRSNGAAQAACIGQVTRPTTGARALPDSRRTGGSQPGKSSPPFSRGKPADIGSAEQTRPRPGPVIGAHDDQPPPHGPC